MKIMRMEADINRPSEIIRCLLADLPSAASAVRYARAVAAYATDFAMAREYTLAADMIERQSGKSEK